MLSDFQIFHQRVQLVAAESFTAILKGRKKKQMKTGMKLYSWWRIFMLVISDAITRQELIKNISIDKASPGLKEGNDWSANIRIFHLSTCLVLELASLHHCFLSCWWDPLPGVLWWKLESRCICFIWVFQRRSEILFPLLKQRFQYNSVPPASLWAAFNQTKAHNFHCVIHVHLAWE